MTPNAGDPLPSLAMCSIVSANYLATAQVVVFSFLEHNPAATAVVLVIDGAEAGSGAWDLDGATVVSPLDLDLDITDVHQMALMYDVLELATALKPFLLAHLLDRFGCPVVYLDSDILVTASFDEVRAAALEHAIVLTPHVVDPFPRDGLGVDEITIQLSGVFNLGFIAVAPGAEPFLRWWAERTRWDSIVAPEQGLFTDQRWIDQVPALFSPKVVRNRGWNVAYWNAHERPLTRAADGRLLAGGDPVVFFHLSGYDVDSPHRLSRYQGPSPRILLSEHPLLREVCDWYRDVLIEAGHPHLRTLPYGFAAVAGARLPQLVRRMARASLLADGDDVVPTPWTEDGAAAFVEWLNRPVASADGSVLTRLLLEVWTHRVDLQLEIPDPMGAGLRRLARWAEEDADFQAQYGQLHRPEPAPSPTWPTPTDHDLAVASAAPESPRRVEPAAHPTDLAIRLDNNEWNLPGRNRVIDELQHRLDLVLEESRAVQSELDALRSTRLLRWTARPRRLYSAMRRRRTR